NEFMKLTESKAGQAAADGVSLMKKVIPMLRQMLQDEWQGAQDFGPDVISYHPKSLGGYHIAKKAPVITVQSPTDNAFVQTGTPLQLLASAFDREDGEIPSSSFTWTSNLDGTLGTGNDLGVNLSAGTHTVTVTAQDSDSNLSSKTITVIATGLLNDDFEHGSQINFVPYGQTEDTSQATVAADDAISSCGTAVGATVWYHFTAPASAIYQFDTLGSDYDTVLVVSSGPREAQIAEGCNDDSGILQSKLELVLTQGTEYHNWRQRRSNRKLDV
ncbi:MAG: PKD domain-containing protein, partial [Chloroflexota bacterium]